MTPQGETADTADAAVVTEPTVDAPAEPTGEDAGKEPGKVRRKAKDKAAGAVKRDATLAAAAELARAALVGVAEDGSVGDHLGMTMLEERLGQHTFACTSTAYPGWHWAATVARVPRGKVATICETNLVPGEGALLSPPWVPYAERLAPGDIGPGDVTPFVADDPLLEAGFEATGDEELDAMAQWELGLGRARVLSALGREAAARRWYEGSAGPRTPVAEKAPAPCHTCGYYLPMAGALRPIFGVCANEWSPSDGHVVSRDHGCGAHSEVDSERAEPEVIAPPIVDDYLVDVTP